MESAQDQRRRKLGPGGSEISERAPDVFDQLGNDGLKAQVEEARALQLGGADEEQPLLQGLIASEQGPELHADPDQQFGPAPQQEAEEEGVEAPPEQLHDRASGELPVLSDPEEVVVAAAQLQVDPVLLMQPKDLGSSDQAKEQALGTEGERALLLGIQGASATLGAVAMDAASQQIVVDQVRKDLTVVEILEARREGTVDELAEAALRRNALRSREEVILLLQRLVSTRSELETIVSAGDPASIAIQLTEYLAVMLVELDDLRALAAYDHADILKRVVLSDDAVTVDRQLSPLALRMGGFASVLYQLVVDDLQMHPLPEPGQTQGVVAADAQKDLARRSEAFEPRVLSIVNFLRLMRNAST